MVPHLVRAWSAYKDLRIRLFHHTHTHTLQIHALLVMGWYNERKENDRSVYTEEKRRVFNFDLEKKKSEDECLTERGRELQITGPMH